MGLALRFVVRAAVFWKAWNFIASDAAGGKNDKPGGPHIYMLLKSKFNLHVSGLHSKRENLVGGLKLKMGSSSPIFGVQIPKIFEETTTQKSWITSVSQVYNP